MKKLARRLAAVRPMLRRKGPAAIVLMALLIAFAGLQGVSANPDPPAEVDVQAVSKDVFATIDEKDVQLNLPDSDGDGLPNAAEDLIGTDDGNPDSDSDGFSDGHEVNVGTNPKSDASTPPPDSDGDGLSDVLEALIGTCASDTPTACEYQGLGFDPGTQAWDSDGDGFGDQDEFFGGSDPTVSQPDPPPGDTSGDDDDDGLSNFQESLLGTCASDVPVSCEDQTFDPGTQAWDSDGDGFGDGHEVGWGYNPKDGPSPPADDDWDGLSNDVEALIVAPLCPPEGLLAGTNPNEWDTDFDGFGDRDEVFRGSDPCDPDSVPPDLPQFPVGETVPFEVVEVIGLDETVVPLEFVGSVPVQVNENLNGWGDCTLSFHGDPIQVDGTPANLRDVEFYSNGDPLSPEGGVATAPQGQGLSMNFVIDLLPGEQITLNETWDFTCEETSQHSFDLWKDVWPADEVGDFDPSNNNLQTQFEVIIFAEVDVQAVSKNVFIDGEQVNLPDADNDGLPDASEGLIVDPPVCPEGTAPDDWDSDDDEFSDGHEVNVGTNPCDDNSTPPLDSDGDGLSDLVEGLLNTCASELEPCPDGDPWDSDGDGFGDQHEFNSGSDPNDPSSIPPDTPWEDADGDGLPDASEALIDTCASDVPISCEEQTFPPDTQAWDSDGDEFGDRHEVDVGTDPLDPDSHPPLDSDWDGLSDDVEALIVGLECPEGTDTNEWDTDGDGSGDGEEVFRGSDPCDGDDVPPPIPQFAVDETVLFEVVEVIGLDVLTPLGFVGTVPVQVNENLNGWGDCTLSFHVTPAFESLLVEDTLQFWSDEGDVPLVDGTATAPEGRSLGINFVINLPPGDTTLNEMWSFSCTETSQHNFNLWKDVWPAGEHIYDQDQSNNNLGVNFEVGLDYGIAVAMDRIKMTRLGYIQMEVGESNTMKIQTWLDILCVTEGTFYVDIYVDASPQDEQVDHDRSDNQLQEVMEVECVPQDD